MTDGFRRQGRISHEVPVIIDIGKCIQPVALLDHLHDIRDGKYTMGIEFHSLLPDGNGEIEFASSLQHFPHIFPTHDMPAIIDAVAVSPQAKMLQGMKTGQGIAVVGQTNQSDGKQRSRKNFSDCGYP